MGKTISFIFGVSVGVLIGWGVARRYFIKECDTNEEMDIILEDDGVKNDTEIASKIINQNDYYSVENPYVITPEEFGSIDGYYTVSLYYFEDDVITDDEFQPIDYDILGNLSVSEHFGEYEDDTVFIRSDIHKCDYEILKDGRRYSEVR